MKLYHWSLNAKKILKHGFCNQTSRLTMKKEGIWLTNKLLGPLDGIHKDMRLLTIDIPQEDVEPYEKTDKGSGYRAFSIPAEIVNKCEIKNPTVYSDRGILKINKPTSDLS